MIAIRFSHYYKKMPQNVSQCITTLEDVELVNLEDLDPAFLEADTAFVGGGHYPLPKKGKYMILWLKSDAGIFTHPWQTIRRWTPEKEAYYRHHIKEQVKIDVA